MCVSNIILPQLFESMITNFFQLTRNFQRFLTLKTGFTVFRSENAENSFIKFEAPYQFFDGRRKDFLLFYF